MQDIRWKTLWIGISLLAITVVVWLASNLVNALAFLCLALALYITSHIYWIYKLQRWLKTPNLNEIPEGRGI